MARAEDAPYTELSRREIAASGFGTSTRAISAFEDLQRAAFSDAPASSGEAQAAAEAAAAAADSAAETAGTAQETAGQAVTDAAAAQDRADAAHDLAETKVTKNAGPPFAAASGTASRTAFSTYGGGAASAAYDPAQMQALINNVKTLSEHIKAMIDDGRSNGTFTA